jgi:hypothetical protein
MLLAKVFQVFQPIGGVRARPSNFWANAVVARQRQRTSSFLMGLGVR